MQPVQATRTGCPASGLLRIHIATAKLYYFLIQFKI
jgi:hypothetical protein